MIGQTISPYRILEGNLGDRGWAWSTGRRTRALIASSPCWGTQHPFATPNKLLL